MSTRHNPELEIHRPCSLVRSLTVTVLCSLFANLGSLAADDRLTVLKNATQGFKQAGKTVASRKSQAELLEIASQKKSEHRELAKLIVARDLLSLNLQSAQQSFGKRFTEAEALTRGLFAEGVIASGIKELIGQEPDFAQDALDIMKTLSPSIDRGLQAMTSSMEAARNGLLLEKLIRQEIRNSIAKLREHESSKFSDKVGLLESFYESKSTPEPHTSFKLTNRSGKDLAEAFIFLEVECEYDFSTSKKQNAIGQALVDLVSGGTGPNYGPRGDAFKKLSNTDKGGFFYVEDWKVGQIIELTTIPVWEYIHTAKSAKLEVVCTEYVSRESVDLEKHKKRLRSKFEPKKAR